MNFQSLFASLTEWRQKDPVTESSEADYAEGFLRGFAEVRAGIAPDLVDDRSIAFRTGYTDGWSAGQLARSDNGVASPLAAA